MISRFQTAHPTSSEVQRTLSSLQSKLTPAQVVEHAKLCSQITTGLQRELWRLVHCQALRAQAH